MSALQPQRVPVTDLTQWGKTPVEEEEWLNTHQMIHQFLAQAAGTAVPYLEIPSPAPARELYQWQSYHAAVHQGLWAVL